MGITAIAAKFKSFNFTEQAEAIINDDPGKVSDLIKQQLLDGKAKDGSFLQSMSTDPFFKKPGAWERYAANKMRKFPSNVRPFDVPNLIFSSPGKYHPGIKVVAMNGVIIYPNTSVIASSVQAKFSPDKTMGLTEASKDVYRSNVLYKGLKERLNRAVL